MAGDCLLKVVRVLERLKWLLSASRVCECLPSSTNENIVEVIKVLLDTFQVDVL
jgi:hypothetical protein